MTKKITALKAQKNNPQRINVYLDGEFAFGISHIVGAWLQVGQELHEAKIEDLTARDAVEKAYQKALRYLSYRPRSEAEVVRNLRKREIPEAVIEATKEKLRNNGLLDDQKFAQLWVENRSDLRPRGPFALRMELRQKGVDDETIERALKDLDEEKLAYKAAKKKSRRYEGKEIEWVDFRKKLGGFLARRGFNYEIIPFAVQKVWDERVRPKLSNNIDNEVAK